MAKPIDRAMVEHVARLAQLQLSDDELTRLERELGEVLEYVERLKAIDTSEVEPMTAPIDRSTPLDPDEPRKPLPADALRRIAPATLDQYIAVPKVIGVEE